MSDMLCKSINTTKASNASHGLCEESDCHSLLFEANKH